MRDNSEFPRNPSRRDMHKQHQVAITIAGMQDTLLEVGFVPELVTDPGRLPSDDTDFNWQTYTGELF